MNKKFKNNNRNNDRDNLNINKVYLINLMKKAEEMARKSKDLKVNQLIKKRSNF